jgi:hypothetical protein
MIFCRILSSKLEFKIVPADLVYRLSTGKQHGRLQLLPKMINNAFDAIRAADGGSEQNGAANRDPRDTNLARSFLDLGRI